MKKSIPLFAGVIISFIVLWLINDVIVVDECIEQGGHFQYETGKCLLDNAEIYIVNSVSVLMGIYFIIALSVAISTSFLIRKIFKIAQ